MDTSSPILQAILSGSAQPATQVLGAAPASTGTGSVLSNQVAQQNQAMEKQRAEQAARRAPVDNAAAFQNISQSKAYQALSPGDQEVVRHALVDGSSRDAVQQQLANNLSIPNSLKNAVLNAVGG